METNTDSDPQDKETTPAADGKYTDPKATSGQGSNDATPALYTKEINDPKAGNGFKPRVTVKDIKDVILGKNV